MDQMTLYKTYTYGGYDTHHFYHYVGVTDLDVLRVQSRRRRDDKRCPENAVIHHHNYGTPCTDVEHEEFLVVKE